MKGIAISGDQWGYERRIVRVIRKAFAKAPHASGREADIYRTMLSCLELECSLVARTRLGRIVGHVMFTEVKIDGQYCNWCGLGPVSVLPRWQKQGIGSALIERGLAVLRDRMEWHGCVVLGDPAFYGRFGFQHDPALVLPGVPQEYFQRIVFRGEAPDGVVSYARPFEQAA